MTLNSYMGYDAIKPFLEEDYGGCFILCKTSNPSSNEFQILRTRDTDGEERYLYEIFAKKAAEWGTGVVVGATDGKVGSIAICSRKAKCLCLGSAQRPRPLPQHLDPRPRRGCPGR